MAICFKDVLWLSFDMTFRAIISCTVILISFAGITGSAKDFGNHGNVFEITETPIYEMIRNKLKEKEAAGELDELNEMFKKRVIEGVERPPAVQGLSEAKEPNHYMFDPSIEIGRDIDDGRGNLLAKAGTVINPLQHVGLGDDLLFVRGDKTSHMDLAIELREARDGGLKVIFVDGAPLEAMRNHGFRIFFDQGGAMVRRFEITKVPALVEQEGLLLKISEIPADG